MKKHHIIRMTLDCVGLAQSVSYESFTAMLI